MSTHSFIDVPTANDALSLATEVARIADNLGKSNAPRVIGIHGEWGSGKTSFMRQLQVALGADLLDQSLVEPPKTKLPPKAQAALQSRVVTVWFDAWRYQNEASPAVALLHEMREQMCAMPKLKQKLRKLGTIVTYGLLDGIADLGKAIGVDGLPSPEKIEKRAEVWEKDNFELTLSSASIRQKLCETIKFLLPNAVDAKVIVFIDDLDRCNAKTSIRLLEALKIYFALPNCIFVLGMNERILVDSIRDEISTPFSSEIADSGGSQSKASQLRASHYLEKICNDIYRLPLPKDPLLYFCSFINDHNQRDALIECTFGITCLPPNPRRIKSLANQWSRFSNYIPFPENENLCGIWAARVLIASYIHQFHRDLWERWHFNFDFWNEISAFCNGEREAVRPEWSVGLTKTHRVTDFDEVTGRPVIATLFSNPGDVDNFWISSLIIKYKDHLLASDFKPLLGL